MKIQAKKSLGQNFLVEEKALNDIIIAGEIKPGDIVVEIGPGTGNLTEKLLNAGALVIAIEKDSRLIEPLREKFSEKLNMKMFSITEADILETDITSIVGNRPYKLIANIPYYITGQIIRKFLESKHQPINIVIMVQKEVAKRVTDTKESILSLSVKAFGLPKLERIVKAGAFNPAPDVDSAILSIKNINKANFKDENEEKVFFEVIKLAFSSKRKFAINNVQKGFNNSNLAKKWLEIGLNPKERSENIPLEKWIEITKSLI